MRELLDRPGCTFLTWTERLKQGPGKRFPLREGCEGLEQDPELHQTHKRQHHVQRGAYQK
jgi:hypothetical protein